MMWQSGNTVGSLVDFGEERGCIRWGPIPVEYYTPGEKRTTKACVARKRLSSLH